MENRLEHLNQVNDVPVHSVLDPEFASYGRWSRAMISVR